jgi:hypothetical protein
MVYPRADLAYASAVRLRVLDILSRLQTREADEGVLSSDEQALRELCERLHSRLIAPTEKKAVESGDPSPLEGLATVVAARGDPPPDKIAFDGSSEELAALTGEIQVRNSELRLPIVVPGGREWVGVTYLLTLTFVAYLSMLLVSLVIIVLANRGPSRSDSLPSLVLFWHVGAVFAVFWFAVG